MLFSIFDVKSYTTFAIVCLYKHRLIYNFNCFFSAFLLYIAEMTFSLGDCLRMFCFKTLLV